MPDSRPNPFYLNQKRGRYRRFSSEKHGTLRDNTIFYIAKSQISCLSLDTVVNRTCYSINGKSFESMWAVQLYSESMWAVQLYSYVTSVNSVFVSDKIINISDKFFN